jgi:malonyl-CoA O-methyltransferase
VINLFRRIAKLSPLEGYNRWAKSYHAEANPIKQLSDEFIAKSLPELKGRSVLDAGCGTGKFCTMAEQGGASLVKGIDLSPAMIEEAKSNCPQGTFECVDLEVAKLDKFDVVICGLVLGHINNFMLPKLIGALKPGGHLIITDFHPQQTMMKARRTFKDITSGRTFEITHTLHPLDEYFSIMRNSNVSIVSFVESRFRNSAVIFGIHAILP